MDPNAALAALIEAFADSDRDVAIEQLHALLDWLVMKGAMPDPDKVSELLERLK